MNEFGLFYVFYVCLRLWEIESSKNLKKTHHRSNLYSLAHARPHSNSNTCTQAYTYKHTYKNRSSLLEVFLERIIEPLIQQYTQKESNCAQVSLEQHQCDTTTMSGDSVIYLFLCSRSFNFNKCNVCCCCV